MNIAHQVLVFDKANYTYDMVDECYICGSPHSVTPDTATHRKGVIQLQN